MYSSDFLRRCFPHYRLGDAQEQLHNLGIPTVAIMCHCFPLALHVLYRQLLQIFSPELPHFYRVAHYSLLVGVKYKHARVYPRTRHLISMAYKYKHAMHSEYMVCFHSSTVSVTKFSATTPSKAKKVMLTAVLPWVDF